MKDFFADNAQLSMDFVRKLQAHPGWPVVRSMEEGLQIAQEVWDNERDPFSYLPQRCIRTLVRQTLYAEVVAQKLKAESPDVAEWYEHRMRHLSVAAEALAYCYGEKLLHPEAEPLALAALGMLQAHEAGVIDSAIDSRFEALELTSVTEATKSQ